MRGETPPSTPLPNEVHRYQEADPQIYVASLADYTNGHLHGDWIDAVQEPEDIEEDIGLMLDKSRIAHNPGEWAIHDYEGFGAFQVGEYEQLSVVSLVANGIAKHGREFSHWVNTVGTEDTDRLDKFDQHYRGTWDSMAHYAEDFLEDMGGLPEHLVTGWLQPYVKIDYEALGRDLAVDLETAEDPQGHVHVFDPEL